MRHAVFRRLRTDKHARDVVLERTEAKTQVSRTLIIFGIVLIATGLLWPLIAKLGLGRLPGDIVIERANFTLYIPISTSILVSIVITALLWLLHR